MIEQEDVVVIEGVIIYSQLPQVFSVLGICFEMFIMVVRCYLGFNFEVCHPRCVYMN